jgi:precorrin-3B synthase
MTAAHLRKGWCPGALRPMRSGDGLLLRVRPRAGAFSISALREIATTAARFGSGEIDLTNRGNLQLRGISDDTHGSAIAALREIGLIDQSIGAEAVRNVVVDPLSGIDPARADVRELAVDLETALAEDQRLWSLPGKFGFSFSGTAEPCVGGRATDIMIASDGDCLKVFLDGATEVVCKASSNDVVAAVEHVALVFLELRENDLSLRRMRDAVARLGALTIFAMAGLHAGSSTTIGAGGRLAPVGLLAHQGNAFCVGIGLPFGRVVAEGLDALCEVATAAGISDVYTSPERVLVFPTGDGEGGAALLEVASELGLITVVQDIRLAMDVCPGSPACANASTETRGDAERLVGAFTGSLNAYSLHVSGCEKGCARNAKADFTMVARHGRYDLIRDGVPGDPVAISGVGPDEISDAISRYLMEAAS